jgi:site-specific recombinase XerD
VPALIADQGEHAARCYVEFTANIRNPNTRRAYGRAAAGFFAWCELRRLTLATIQPSHVAMWVEQQGRAGRSAPTIKQQLAAVRADSNSSRPPVTI